MLSIVFGGKILCVNSLDLFFTHQKNKQYMIIKTLKSGFCFAIDLNINPLITILNSV